MTKLIYTIIILILVVPANLYAEKVTVEKKNNHKTIFVNLRHYRTTETVRKYTSNKIRSGLKTIKYCSLIKNDCLNSLPTKDSDNSYTKYANNAKTCGKRLSAHRVIFGSIKRVKYKYSTRKGETGSDQYIGRIHHVDHLLMTLEIFSIDEDEKIAEIKLKAQSTKKSLDRAVSRAIEEIKKYYGPRRIILSRDRLEFSISLAGTFLLTEGPFQDFAKYGYGASAAFTVTNLFFPGMSTQIYLGYYYIDEQKLQIDALHSFFSLVLVGYAFNTHKYLRTTPYAGLGYHFHYAVEYTGNKEFFYDPYCSLQSEFSIPFGKEYAFFITPGYNIFFEQKNLGRYFSIYAGFKYIWHE